MTQLHRKLARRAAKGNRVLKPMDPELKQMVERMTNWQRNQWARTGYKASSAFGCLLMRRGMRTSMTGRLSPQPTPNPQNIPIRTPEGAAIREAFTGS